MKGKKHSLRLVQLVGGWLDTHGRLIDSDLEAKGGTALCSPRLALVAGVLVGGCFWGAARYVCRTCWFEGGRAAAWVDNAGNPALIWVDNPIVG